MRWVSGLLVFWVAAALLTWAQNSGKSPPRNDDANHDLGFTDTPVLPGLPYHVHDPARPHPRIVTAGTEPGAPPSDAMVLFDGESLSEWTFERQSIAANRPDSPPLGWKLGKGYVEVVPRAGDMVSKAKFGDVQLHVEWASPAVIEGASQNRGNSGIFLQGRYEVQVLDSFQNPTYADGQAGAIYGQWPPLVNPARRPAEWQSYDIVFEAPKLEGAKVVKPAYLTVFLNGVLLHHHKEVMGPTVYRQVAHYAPQPAEDSLMLQNHNTPARFRNIWIRRLAGYDQPER